MQAYQQYRVRLSDNPDGTPRWTGEGAEGLGKGGVKAWSKLDIVAADRRPLAPAVDPPVHPFQVNRINEHWQASGGGLWGDGHLATVHAVAAGQQLHPAGVGAALRFLLAHTLLLVLLVLSPVLQPVCAHDCAGGPVRQCGWH